MNRLIILIISLFFLNQCSFSENSRPWKNKDKELKKPKNIKKIFSEDKMIAAEFNQGLKLDLAKTKTNNKIIDNKNNYHLHCVFNCFVCAPVLKSKCSGGDRRMHFKSHIFA